MRHIAFSAFLCFVGFHCFAQTTSPVLLGAGNVNPLPLSVAPGQLLTLFVQPPGGTSTISPSNVSATYSNASDQPMPVVSVDPASVACAAVATSDCAQSYAVTVQVPFAIQTVCYVCANPLQPSGSIAVTVNGVKSAYIPVQPLPDRVHILTACDVSIAGASFSPSFGGLPCTPMVTHADGTLVSSSRPAQTREELVAYATGLGQTDPALTTGQPAAASSPTLTTFALDFNFHPNALPSKPLPASVTGFAPVFTGATKGYVGLYQINFVVPAPPAGLPSCAVPTATLVNGNIAQSNLTVSVGSIFSFDGAGLCVATASGS
jgi:uncharacterized protein (TIGR03437 family)